MKICKLFSEEKNDFYIWENAKWCGLFDKNVNGYILSFYFKNKLQNSNKKFHVLFIDRIFVFHIEKWFVKNFHILIIEKTCSYVLFMPLRNWK